MELRPNADLIDPNFEGYKLFLDSISGTHFDLKQGVHKVKQASNEYSYLLTVLLNMHNHLYYDPWSNNFYYVDTNFSVVKLATQDCFDGPSTVVLRLECPDIEPETPFNVSLKFTNESKIIIADGLGYLYIIQTEHLPNESITDAKRELWRIESKCKIPAVGDRFMVLDAQIVCSSNENSDSNSEIHCLLADVKRNEATGRSNTYLYWTLFAGTNDGWKLIDVTALRTESVVNYSNFSNNGQRLFVESTKDLEIESSEKGSSFSLGTPGPASIKYYWRQSDHEVKIWCPVSSNPESSVVTLDTNDTNVTVKVNDAIHLSGSTYHSFHSELLTWNHTERSLELESFQVVDPPTSVLEISLTKKEKGLMWPYLIANDETGEQVPDAELAEEVHKRLSHLCTENEVMSNETGPGFNPGQLESIDNPPTDGSVLFEVERQTRRVIRQVNMTGHRKLFNVQLSPDEMAAICVRHDVDATVWRIGKDSLLCEHVGTLNAFGYVLASKDYKYVTCSPDLRYAVVALERKTIFIYRSKCLVNSGELRNRKTGHRYSSVGKQHIINLDTADEILGVQALNDVLVVLTANRIFNYYMRKFQCESNGI